MSNPTCNFNATFSRQWGVLLASLLAGSKMLPAGAAATAQDSGAETPIQITIDVAQKGAVVPSHFLGINLSYFNDTEDLWRTHAISETLRTAGIQALRYPGGQETSFFHWRHPGVNGYEDLWDDPQVWGSAVGRGRFQATWVAPAEWNSNRQFMDFDRFMYCCQALGAEPVVGLNLSSGRKHHRREDGLAEALDWFRYCRQRGYRVTYWYLDNEPWNVGANITLSDQDYIEEILFYGRAIKREFPGAKLIINPLSSAHIGDWPRLERFVRAAGEVVDYVDVHYYWEWGRSSRARWQAKTPMESSDQWKPVEQAMPYRDELAQVRAVCARAGYPEIGVTVLEWNIGPSQESRSFPPALEALIQAEMLMQFLEARVEIACLWPLIWRSNPAVWPHAHPFPSIVTPDPPFTPTPTHDLFRHVAAVLGSSRLAASVDRPDVPTLAFLRPDGQQLQVMILNKTSIPGRVSLRLRSPMELRMVGVDTISLAGGVAPRDMRSSGSRADFIAPPLSFNLVVLNCAGSSSN